MVIGTQISLPDAEREALGRVALAGLKAMACFKGDPSPKAMAAIVAVRDHLMRIDVDIDSLEPLQPQELAKQLIAINDDPQWRGRVLRGMTLIAMFDGELTEDHLQFLSDAAKVLQVDEAPVTTYRKAMSNRLMILRFDIVRRSFMSDVIKSSLRQDGLRGALATARVVLGQQDKGMAAHYRTLIDYPEGSFGKAYADFILRNGFSFPGEVGGPPPPVMRHDCCHVLGGYGTTPREEGAVIGFQAGFEKLDPFDALMFVMAEFELGIGVSPTVQAEKNKLDPEYIFAGIEHGQQVNADLLCDVDPWDHFADPIEDVRQRFNVLPRGREPEYLDT